MYAPTIRSIGFFANASTRERFTLPADFITDAGNALTSVQAVGQVRSVPGATGAAILQLDISSVDGAGGYTVDVSPDEAATLLPGGVLHYDILAQMPASQEWFVVAFGFATVAPGVTIAPISPPSGSVGSLLLLGLL